MSVLSDDANPRASPFKMHAMLTASSSFASVVSRRAPRTVTARAGAVSVTASADRPLWCVAPPPVAHRASPRRHTRCDALRRGGGRPAPPRLRV